MSETQNENENTQILFNDVRLSYFYGYKPYTGDDGKTNYTAHLIFGENHPQLPALFALIQRVAAKEWKDKAAETLQQLKAQDRLCIHRGDISKSGQEAYAGKLYISANRRGDLGPPLILATIDNVNQEVPAGHPLAPYSGCWANVTFRVWAQPQSSGWGKRINAELTGVQFRRHDKRLGGGGGVAKLTEFGIVPADADGATPLTSSNGAGLI